MYIRSNIINNENHILLFSNILHKLNERYDNNIEYRRIAKRNNKIIVTLKVKDSKKIGSRISPKGRRIASACFHVYKDFIYEVYRVDENAKVESALYKYKDIADFINNYDKVAKVNVGSYYNTFNYGEACNCSEFKVEKKRMLIL